jgi:signal transduction histidine kinase
MLAAAVLVIGLAVTLLMANVQRSAQRESADRVMDQRTAVARAAVSTETQRYRDLLQTVAAGIGADARFTGADFIAITQPLARAQLLGATTVAYVVPTRSGQIAATQAFWRKRGAAGLTLDPVPGRDEHLFSIFARAVTAAGSGAAGLDVAGSPEAGAALQEARRTLQTTVSDTYVLLRDRLLPPARQQLSFAFVAPVVGPDAVFRGWVVLGMHGQELLDGVLRIASQRQLDGELLASNADGRRVRVAAYAARGTPDLVREATVPVANRQWTLVTRADSTYLPGARSLLALMIRLGGSVLTLVLAWLVYVLATGRSRARHQVEVATAELRTAEAESRRHAGLLGAIMASLGDGVGVVDESGAFLLHNPAAKALLGVGDDVSGPQEWQEHYGLYRPDGRTPFPLEEMPLVRALHGESVNGVEMVIRNPERPDGILVSVDGRPLDPSAGQHGAVAVFRDITELRRYETDLAVFAGVVAHDLKAPLAIIRGHCENTADDLDDAPQTPSVRTARDGLDRIAGVVDRMASMIDTLLAYTTARDAPLRLQTVPLGPLVADVIGDRTTHRRPADGPRPEIYVGPLPEVQADPAMLRHVVDNLIGNALKYVPAGRAPHIDVTATPSEGWTRVEIADRGIGIPDADKASIFESFHRAHAGQGYAGTGLGLAICQRIVERHGGTIGVADNPGGGTRFHFTLPLSGRPEPEPATPAAGPVTPALEPSSADADRAALERARAARTAVEDVALPGLAALPASAPPIPVPGPAAKPTAGGDRSY